MKIIQIINPMMEYHNRVTSINRHLQNYREYKYFDNNDELAEIELQKAEEEEQELGRFLNMEV